MFDSEPITSEKEFVYVQTAQVFLSQRAHECVRGAPQVAASDDHVDLRVAGQLGGDVDGAGDDCDVAQARQMPRNLHVGRAWAENDRVARLDERRGRGADEALFLDELPRLFTECR